MDECGLMRKINLPSPPLFFLFLPLARPLPGGQEVRGRGERFTCYNSNRKEKKHYLLEYQIELSLVP